jgi:predicted HicB family RNase H-like nuclease
MAPSGKVLLRMPVDLHGHLVVQAEKQGVSLNTLILTLLAGGSNFKLGHD